MNDLLQLKGSFINKSRTSGGGASLPANSFVELQNVQKLYNDLLRMREFWLKETLINGALISVYYKRVIPKSRRIGGLLCKNGVSSNSTIRGARFINHEGNKKHLITHYVTFEMLNLSISRLKYTIEILSHHLGGRVSDTQLKTPQLRKKNIDFGNIAMTTFQRVIVDCYFVEKFDVLEYDQKLKEKSIISIFETDIDTKVLMERIGIDILSNRILDNTTLLLMPDQMELLKSKAPYLIAMAVHDLSELSKDALLDYDDDNILSLIPKPSSEPVIGVIDTLFDKRVYFSDWVEYHKMIDDSIPVEKKDFEHGTMVSSIIVDGHNINPDLDDGCGRFRVRHFGVASGSKFSSFSIVRTIKDIVVANKDIKVWNISLGSNEEIEKNFVSPEAAILDQIQFENDVIFVISGTNKPYNRKDDMAIGSPADSINSLVVNSIDINQRPTDYTRRGIVLSFFNKPDVSYYGGCKDKPMKVCDPNGERFVIGTSFAAPWISRKIAYLIHIMGLSREVAKALIIDSAIGWNPNQSINNTSLVGHGIVPIRIEDVVTSNDDEIKFVLSGSSEQYDTYNYNIPIPVHKEEHPFVARATMCYIPRCSRNQGVDYTNTELDIYFGRINDKGKINSINKNNQSIEGVNGYVTEEEAREYYRKWDNSKHVAEELKPKSKPRKTYDSKMWGISVKRKERLHPYDGIGIKFGVVVTLKELAGVNRIDTFIQQCFMRGWLVNKLNVQNRVEIYLKADEELKLE